MSLDAGAVFRKGDWVQVVYPSPEYRGQVGNVFEEPEGAKVRIRTQSGISSWHLASSLRLCIFPDGIDTDEDRIAWLRMGGLR